MPKPLLIPWHPRDQMRLLGWLCLEPARFTGYTQRTVTDSFAQDMYGLLLPDGTPPERLIIVHKLAMGVNSPRDYRNDFALELQKAFDVPDQQMPDKIMVQYRTDAWTGIGERCLLSPAAHALIRYRRALDVRVQRASGWLGTSLALLPVLAMILIYGLRELDPALLLPLLACFGVAWVGFGLTFKKDDYLTNSWWEDLRGLLAGGAVCGLMGALLVVVLGLPLLHIGWLALAVIVGSSYGSAANLPARHPLTLMRANLLVLMLAVGIQATRGSVMLVFPPAALLLGTLLTTKAILWRGLMTGRAAPIQRWLLGVLVSAYGLLIVGGLF